MGDKKEKYLKDIKVIRLDIISFIVGIVILSIFSYLLNEKSIFIFTMIEVGYFLDKKNRCKNSMLVFYNIINFIMVLIAILDYFFI